MLRKDKMMLESLTRKYGKKNLLNEMDMLGVRGLEKSIRKIRFKIGKIIDFISHSFDIDIFSLKNIKPFLFIELNEKNYKVEEVIYDWKNYETISYDTDFEDLIFVVSDENDKEIEISLKEIEDVNELLHIQEWFGRHKRDIIEVIEEDLDR